MKKISGNDIIMVLIVECAIFLVYSMVIMDIGMLLSGVILTIATFLIGLWQYKKAGKKIKNPMAF